MSLLYDHHLGGLLSEAHGGSSGPRVLAVALWGWRSLPKLWGMAPQYGVPGSWGLPVHPRPHPAHALLAQFQTLMRYSSPLGCL